MSAGSGDKISIKGECSFLFSNFLITGLCNSLANSSLGITSFLTASPGVFFYKKIYKPL